MQLMSTLPLFDLKIYKFKHTIILNLYLCLEMKNYALSIIMLQKSIIFPFLDPVLYGSYLFSNRNFTKKYKISKIESIKKYKISKIESIKKYKISKIESIKKHKISKI
jgi:hypothetical protein